MQYSQFDSCHPLYVEKCVPKSLNVRANKSYALCSDQINLINYQKNLTVHLVAEDTLRKL